MARIIMDPTSVANAAKFGATWMPKQDYGDVPDASGWTVDGTWKFADGRSFEVGHWDATPSNQTPTPAVAALVAKHTADQNAAQAALAELFALGVKQAPPPADDDDSMVGPLAIAAAIAFGLYLLSRKRGK